MNEASFDTMTRRSAGGQSRRASLGMLGVAGLAAVLTRPDDGAARKKKKPADRCKTQQAPCNAEFLPLCQGDSTCIALVRRCCAFTGTCDINGFFDCLEP